MQQRFIKPAKAGRPKAVNDNCHNQFMWDFLHTYLDLWFEVNNAPRTPQLYNRFLHYTYELKNRPWIQDEICTLDVIKWLRAEAIDLGITVVGPVQEHLHERGL